jgi:hypothetical protein
LSVEASAHAQELAEDEPPPQSSTAPSLLGRTSITGDRLAFLAQLGLGAPTGTIGVEADIAPIRYLGLNFGVGATPNGVQFSGTIRLRIPVSRRVLIGPGTGLSFGRHISGGTDCWCGSDDSTPAEVYNRAYWQNIEFVVDLYAKRGRGIAQFAAGYGHLLNPNDFECRPPSINAASTECKSTDNWWPFLSASYGFDL